MAKEIFSIGETEKHEIIVKWSLFMKHLIIEIDGEKVLDKFHYSPAPEINRFDVGSSEKHVVEISAGGFSSIKLTLDGKSVEGKQYS